MNKLYKFLQPHYSHGEKWKQLNKDSRDWKNQPRESYNYSLGQDVIDNNEGSLSLY